MEETHRNQPSINLLQKSTFLNSAQQQLIKQIQVQLPQLTQQTKDLNISDWKRKNNNIVKYDDQNGHFLDGGFDESVVSDISVPKMLYRGLNQDPNTVILIDHLKKERYTSVEFRDRMETIAKNLLNLGFKRGDVAAYFVSNSIDTIAFLAACFRVGIVPAGCNNLQRTDELKRQLELCGASLIFTDLPLVMTSVTASRGCPKVKKVILMGGEHPDCVTFNDFFSTKNLPVLPSLDELDLKSDDVAMVIFSSGTTGVEKAVLLSHRNIQAQFTVSVGENVRKIQNNQVVFASVAHLSGSIITIFGISLGFTTYLLTKFDLNSYLHLLSQNKIRTISLIPVLANQLAKSAEVFKYDLSSLKEIVCGTAPLCREVVDLLIARFPGVCIRQAYGLSECSGMCTMVPGIPLNSSVRQDCHKLGSVGIPLPCVRIKIVCPSGGKVLGPHQQGEILIQSPMVMIGYKDAREGHSAPVAVTSDGWLRSGDLGYFDEDGYLYVVDRLKELIKVRSYQVSPIEIESVLLSHDDVIDAAVFPIPDTSEGAVPAAWVVLRPETKTTHNDLLEYVREKLAPFKHLKGGVDFVDKIPRNHSGKILRKQMKRLN